MKKLMYRCLSNNTDKIHRPADCNQKSKSIYSRANYAYIQFSALIAGSKSIAFPLILCVYYEQPACSKLSSVNVAANNQCTLPDVNSQRVNDLVYWRFSDFNRNQALAVSANEINSCSKKKLGNLSRNWNDCTNIFGVKRHSTREISVKCVNSNTNLSRANSLAKLDWPLNSSPNAPYSQHEHSQSNIQSSFQTF